MKKKSSDQSSTGSTAKTPISLATKLAGLVVEVSEKELEFSPEIDHRRVRSIAWSLGLLFVWATMGVTIGLTISLGHFSWFMLIFAAVVGLIVFNIDRAMVSDKFKQDGLREAKRRGAQCAEPDAWSKNLVRIVFRFSFALIFAALIGEIYAKEFLGPDIAAHTYEANQLNNKPVYAVSVKIADAEIQTVRDEIAVLDKRAASILTQQAAEIEAEQGTLEAQLAALTQERAELRRTFDSLSERYLCAQNNLIAEEFGGTRCDGTTARAGKGPRYNTALYLAEELDRERKAIKGRIDEIDKLLVGLQKAISAPKSSVGSAGTLLASLSTQRAQATSTLNTLLENRETRINDIALADPDYEPLTDGIIQRGEALIDMAQESGWVQLTIASIFLFLFVLDLGAVLVMTITPSPENIVVERVMASAAVSGQIIAGKTVKLANSAEIELEAQKRLIVAKDQIDALKSESRVQMAVRQASEEAVYRDIKEGFASTSKAGPTIH